MWEINIGKLEKQPLSVFTAYQRERISQQGYAEFGEEINTAIHSRVHTLRKELRELACETGALFPRRLASGMLDTVLDMHATQKSAE